VEAFWSNLFIGIIASLIATGLVMIIATTRSRATRRALTAIASHFLNVDVKYVFNDGNEAEKEVQKAIKKATNIRILAGRGNEFQRSFYLPLFEAGNKKIRILLPDTTNPARGTDWLIKREEELKVFDPAFGDGLLRDQVSTNHRFLKTYVENEKIALKGYDLPHIGRIIITDDFVFLTPYSAKTHGRDSRIIQFGRGDMYDFFDRFFELAWEDSK
jgi:type II secretory pathway pseudopilin PulG